MPALGRVPGVVFDLVSDDRDFRQDWLKPGEVVAAARMLWIQ